MDLRARPMGRLAAAVAGIVMASTALGACSASETSKEASAAPTGDRSALVAQFPESVREMVDPLSTDLVRKLLQVRQEGPKNLVWTDSGGEQHAGFRAAFIDDWEKITGWSVKGAVADVDSALAQLKAQVSSGSPEWDVFATLDDASAADLAKQNMFDKLDMSIIPTNLFPEGTRFDSDGRWVDWAPFGTVLVWNTKVWPLSGTHPTSVSDLFDVNRFPGKRCVFNFPQFSSNLEFAAMANGVPTSDVYRSLGTKEGLDAAFGKLSSIRDNLVFASSGADSVQFVLDGECDMGITWNGRPMARVKAKPDLPLAITWKGALMTSGPLAVTRGSKNITAAQSLVALASQPDSQCRIVNELGYGLSLKAEPFPGCVSELAKTWAPQYDEIAGWTDNTFYLAHPELVDDWTLWQTGKRD
jgi:putative spermidine/putrescine transport system substrate-binding protein